MRLVDTPHMTALYTESSNTRVRFAVCNTDTQGSYDMHS